MALIDENYLFLADVDRWENLIKEVFSQGLTCIFHKDKTSMHVGRLISDKPEKLSMICIGCDFKYEKQPFILEKESVSMIELGSEYVRIYSSYSKS